MFLSKYDPLPARASEETGCLKSTIYAEKHGETPILLSDRLIDFPKSTIEATLIDYERLSSDYGATIKMDKT